ncbi:hypothetical protein BG53_01540 [Paenibacillus darwinianus]|uniref:Integral membrane protein n=1 Tax=Paenibacillus darwinianus TaxID=1380763 RepID=A0A9W5S316_9BACL|nr:hypothetical protein [Paenibacillus darwinianus]EXX91401.1 hypothetical protein BG52_10545 [Paenibacillus darwinianus]EXX92233.1 hypothetical protein BG53_01540 [Paenibacillus darwinianus]EXX92339.1 hypothetical protein CH50_11570 [Paenibacillus darwinianus]
MNAGYLACLVWVCAAILLLTGWRRQLIGDFPAARAVAYLAGLIGLMAVSKSGGAAVYYPMLWTGAWATAALAAVRPASRQAYAWFSAVLCSVVWLWSRGLYAVDPVFVLWDARLDPPLLAGALCALTAGGFREHFAVAAFSSLAGLLPVVEETGIWAWADALALTWLTARFASLLTSLLTSLLAGPVPLLRLRAFAYRYKSSRFKEEREP